MVPDGVDEDAAGLRHAVYLADQCVDLFRGQSHAQHHVREGRVHGRVRQSQRVPHVVHDGGPPFRHPRPPGSVTQSLQDRGGEVGGLGGEALAGEVQRVPAVAGAEFERAPGVGGMEDRRRMDCPGRRLDSVDAGTGGAGVLSVLRWVSARSCPSSVTDVVLSCW